MALRAGYYGLKRFVRNKLSILAESMPADISPDNPIAGKNDVLASIDLLKDTTGWLGKNKNKFKINTQESHGVTITRNADDSYTFTGVNDSALFQFFFFTREGTNNLGLSAGRYTLVGGDSQIYVKISKTVNNEGQIIAQTTGNAVEFDYSGTDAPYGFYLEIQAPVGTTFNKTISVMITTPEEYKLSPTYEPYHESVAEMLTPKLLTSANDLDDVKTGGDYYWMQSYPAHSPENNTFGGLCVIPCGEVVHQMVIRGASSSASIYIRRFQETWSNWFKFSGTEVTPASLTKEDETKKQPKKKVIKEEEE